MKILITSGGCKVPIDDVRHIGNFSSGRYGAELLFNFWAGVGSDDVIIFFHEKNSDVGHFDASRSIHRRADRVQPSRLGGGKSQWTASDVTFIEYIDYHDYLRVKDIIKEEQPDIIISVAAVSDYIVDKTTGKISSDNDELIIRLRKGEKVLKSFRELAPDALIVGFKLLVGPTEEEIHHAVDKVFKSGADLVVFNDLNELRKGISDRRLYSVDGDECGYSSYAAPRELVNELLSLKMKKS